MSAIYTPRDQLISRQNGAPQTSIPSSYGSAVNKDRSVDQYQLYKNQLSDSKLGNLSSSPRTWQQDDRRSDPRQLQLYTGRSTTQSSSVYSGVSGERSDIYNYAKDPPASNVVKTGTKNIESNGRSTPGQYSDKLKNPPREQANHLKNYSNTVIESDRSYSRTDNSRGLRTEVSQGSNKYDDMLADYDSLSSARGLYGSKKDAAHDTRLTTSLRKTEGHGSDFKYDSFKSDVTPQSKVPGNEVERKPNLYSPYDVTGSKKSREIDGFSTYDQRQDLMDRYGETYPTGSSGKHQEAPKSGIKTTYDQRQDLMDRYGETYLTGSSEKHQQAPKSGIKTTSAMHDHTLSTSKTLHDTRLSSYEDGRSKIKKFTPDETDYRTQAITADTNKKSASGTSQNQKSLADLKRDLLMEKAQLDQKLKGSLTEKDMSRKLHWDDGWHQSPRKGDDVAHKEKTGNVKGSSTSSSNQHHGDPVNDHHYGKMNGSLASDNHFITELQRGKMNSSLSMGKSSNYSAREDNDKSVPLRTENVRSSSRSGLYDEPSEYSTNRGRQQLLQHVEDSKYPRGNNVLKSSSNLDPRVSSSSHLQKNGHHGNGRLLQDKEIETRLLANNGHHGIARRDTVHGDHRSSITTSHHKYNTYDLPTSKKSAFSLRADLSDAKYDIVHDVLKQLGFTIDFTGKKECCLVWNDSFVSMERIALLQPHQRINHFSGMAEICKKDKFAQLMCKMASTLPAEFSFIPRTWVFPKDVSDFQRHSLELKRKMAGKFYIVKPVAESATVNGIKLYASGEECLAHVGKQPDGVAVVVQEYIDKPLLLQGYKCHLRLYVLITSIDPLRCFIYKDGMFHLAGDKYVSPAENNMGHSSVHITTEPYTNDVANHQQTHHKHLYDGAHRPRKVSLRSVCDQLSNGDSQNMWATLSDLVVKTVLSMVPHIFTNYQLCRVGKIATGSTTSDGSVCFEILGFDVLLDRSLKPFLLQVNRSPNLASSPGDVTDYNIKAGVVEDSMRLVDFRPPLHVSKKDLEKTLTHLNDLENEKSEVQSLHKTKVQHRSEDSVKDELANMVRRLKTNSLSQIFADNCGNFKQVFPPRDKVMLERYIKVLELACVASEPEFDNKRTMEIQHFLIGKQREVIDKALETEKDLMSEVPGSKSSKDTTKIDIDEKTTELTLQALNKAQLTFPGKSPDASERTLDKIQANWNVHKKPAANYWFIVLDCNKQNEVMKIVRNKVQEVVQRTWRRTNVENVGLYRAFNRLFSRLLSNRGQVLWDCLLGSKCWENMFMKSTDALSDVEMACCRRIVQMSCDCLLTTYWVSATRKLDDTSLKTTKPPPPCTRMIKA